MSINGNIISSTNIYNMLIQLPNIYTVLNGWCNRSSILPFFAAKSENRYILYPSTIKIRHYWITGEELKYYNYSTGIILSNIKKLIKSKSYKKIKALLNSQTDRTFEEKSYYFTPKDIKQLGIKSIRNFKDIDFK